jgi:hypothetical protein
MNGTTRSRRYHHSIDRTWLQSGGCVVLLQCLRNNAQEFELPGCEDVSPLELLRFDPLFRFGDYRKDVAQCQETLRSKKLRNSFKFRSDHVWFAFRDTIAFGRNRTIVMGNTEYLIGRRQIRDVVVLKFQ